MAEVVRTLLVGALDEAIEALVVEWSELLAEGRNRGAQLTNLRPHPKLTLIECLMASPSAPVTCIGSKRPTSAANAVGWL